MLLSVVAPVVLVVPAVLAEAVAAAVALKLHDVGQGGSSTELDQEQPLSDELDPDMKMTILQCTNQLKLLLQIYWALWHIFQAKYILAHSHTCVIVQAVSLKSFSVFILSMPSKVIVVVKQLMLLSMIKFWTFLSHFNLSC